MHPISNRDAEPVDDLGRLECGAGRHDEIRNRILR